MEKIKLYFTNIGFDDIESDLIVSNFKLRLFNKGDLFVREGEKSLLLGFIETGQFQYYSVTDQGEEKTTYIALQNTFVASLLTYLTETPARENIRALVNTRLWVVEKQAVLKLQNQIPAFKDFYIKLIEYQICCIDKSRLDFVTLTGEQRYEKFCKEEPDMLQQVPLQYIASMLGITPRHLSRLRKKKQA